MYLWFVYILFVFCPKFVYKKITFLHSDLNIHIFTPQDKKIDESKSQVESGTDGSDTLTTQINQGISPKIISLFKDFLILLYKHIFANFAMKTEFVSFTFLYLF